MNSLVEFYNRKIRLPNLEEQAFISEKRIKHRKGLKNILLPSSYIKLCSKVSFLIDKETSRLSQLRKKKYELKDRFGVIQNAN